LGLASPNGKGSQLMDDNAYIRHQAGSIVDWFQASELTS
jgi:hypothetical protein